MRKVLALLALCALLVPACKKRTPTGSALAATYQVGVFANAENAENLRSSLAEIGYDASVEPFTDKGASYNRVLVRHAGPLEFVYQVGAFASEDNAARLRSELAAQGYEANVRKVTINGTAYFRVYVRNKDSQEAFYGKMKAMGLGEPVFRSLQAL